MIESEDDFIRLSYSYSDDPDERKRSAWAKAPIEVWWQLLDADPARRFCIARNRSVPEEIMIAPAADPQPRVRGRLAGKDSCTPGVLEILSRDEDELVASTVCRSSENSAGALEFLAGHRRAQVREKVQRQFADRENDFW